MNLTGKILTFFITVSSLIFMGLAVAVFVTHQNWYLAVNRTQEETQGGRLPLGYSYQLKNERDKNADLKAQITKLQEEKDAVEKERLQTAAALATALSEKLKEEQTNKEEYAKLEAQAQAAIAAMTANQQNLDQLTQEVDGLRKEIRDTQTDRDKKFDQVVKTTEEIHQTQGELGRQKERNDQLARQAARDKLVFDQLGVNPENPPGATPPMLHGKVLAVNKEKMLEVSLGSDDGLLVGAKLEVYRGSKWLARVEILRTETDRSVAKIIPGFQKGPIQKDDDVATRFKNDLAARSSDR